jgi:hypothetical protein
VVLQDDLVRWDSSGDPVTPNSAVQLRVRPREVYDLQFGPCSAVQAAQRCGKGSPDSGTSRC